MYLNVLVSGERADNGSGDGLGVHARLKTVGKSDESVVGNNSSNTKRSLRVVGGENIGLGDEILNIDGVVELEVGHGKNLGEDGGGEESGVLDDNL